MVDSINYSWTVNFSQSTKPTVKKPETELLAFDLHDEYLLSNNLMLVKNHQTGAHAAFKADVLQLLRSCRNFRSIEEHTAKLKTLFPALSGRSDEITNILSQTQKNGLMTSMQNSISSLQRSDNLPPPPADKPILFIPTCDRPAALERLIVSILANCNTQQLARCIIIDDSRMEENQKKNKLLVKNKIGSQPFQFSYFGASEQEKLKAALTCQLPQFSEEINFLIGVQSEHKIATPGRSRNLALLLSIGQRAIMLDDDILCENFLPPYPKRSIELSTLQREAEFYEHDSDWLAHRAPTSDPLNHHISLLGSELHHLQANIDDSQTKENFFIDSVEALANVNSDSKILITACGTYGDPGTSNNEWLYLLDKISRAKLYSSKEKFIKAKTGRNCWLGRSHFHLSNSASLMTPITGVDNRAFLPPYFPLYRNEDLLFGKMLDFIYPGSLTLDLPHAVPHLPLDTQQRMEKATRITTNLGVLGLTASHLTKFKNQIQSEQPTVRLNTLANLLLDIASAPKETISNIIKKMTYQANSEQLFNLTQALEESTDAPDFWKADIKKRIAIYQTILTTEAELTLAGIPKSICGDDLPDYLANLWRQFGHAVQAWPQIREAASSLDLSNILD